MSNRFKANEPALFQHFPFKQFIETDFHFTAESFIPRLLTYFLHVIFFTRLSVYYVL